MTPTTGLLEAQKMQNIAMRKVGNHEEVKAIMEKIQKKADKGQFSGWICKDKDFSTIDGDTLRTYLELQGFHTKGSTVEILVSWGRKITPFMEVEDCLCDIAKAIDNIE